MLPSSVGHHKAESFRQSQIVAKEMFPFIPCVTADTWNKCSQSNADSKVQPSEDR